MNTESPTAVFVSGLNWLGDGVMSMPALRLYKDQNPSCRIVMGVKESQAALWRMVSYVDDVVVFPSGMFGILRTALQVRRMNCQKAYILPNSFRSALIPFLAGIPSRIGVRGHQRAWMLTNVVSSEGQGSQVHQAWECLRIMGLDVSGSTSLLLPPLSVPPDAVTKAKKLMEFDDSDICVGVFPGAARGPSKRWPSENFTSVLEGLTREFSPKVFLLGTAADEPVCSEVIQKAGEGRYVNLAGLTSVEELTALLQMCRVVLTNDSGGMHLAAAAGVRVVAVFGITDPSVTGPIGNVHSVIVAEGVARARNIKRSSRDAVKALRSIDPERVLDAARRMIKERDV